MLTEMLMAFQSGLIVLMTILWWKERQDLYTRLMAKDLTDYRINADRVPPIKTPKKDFIKL